MSRNRYPQLCPKQEEHGEHLWYPEQDGVRTKVEHWCPGLPVPVPDHNPYKAAAEADPPDLLDWIEAPRLFCGETPDHAPHGFMSQRTGGEPRWCLGSPERIKVDMSPDLSAFNRADDWHRPTAEEIRAAGVPDFQPERYPDEQGWEVDKTGKAERVAREENRALPVRWADRAMFKAEEIDPEDGPKVYLLWMTPDPLGAIAAACKMYKGEVVRHLQNVSDPERLDYFKQVQKTKLKAPFEFVKFHFMIEGVTRAFTHQMVRQRTAAYAQESLRFAVVTGEGQDLPVSLPPSLSGLPDNHPARMAWRTTTDEIQAGYRSLVEDYGVPAEDARGLLPHNVLTRLHYTTDLRALLDHAGNRLCTQAQFEWRLVFARIIAEIRERTTNDYLMADGMQGVYMASALTAPFQPVCYQTGKCEFKAQFDRDCSIRERVDANAEIGRNSSKWGQWHNAEGGSGDPSIAPIKPGEWLLDHTAARRK